MYAVHQGATRLPVDLQCASWGPGDESIPSLSLSASRDAQGRMQLSICNLHPSAGKRLVCDLPGLGPARVTGRVLTAGSLSAHNTAAHLEAVAPAPFEAISVADQTLTVDLPARSVVVLEVAR
jgi:alpha-N-arabinofuranosidase